MSITEKYLVISYSRLFEGLSSQSRMELIKNLTESLNQDLSKNENKFYASFGSFSDHRSAEEIISDIKENRMFKEKDLGF